MAYAYNRQGEPITVDEWSDLVSDYDYRIVAITWVADIRIVTLWVGIQPGCLGGHMIFETRIKGSPWDRHEVERYSTEIEALEGHALAIDLISAITSSTN